MFFLAVRSTERNQLGYLFPSIFFISCGMIPPKPFSVRFTLREIDWWRSRCRKLSGNWRTGLRESSRWPNCTRISLGHDQMNLWNSLHWITHSVLTRNLRLFVISCWGCDKYVYQIFMPPQFLISSTLLTTSFHSNLCELYYWHQGPCFIVGVALLRVPVFQF